MFELDSDENELILDDHENEVKFSLWGLVETGVIQRNQASMNASNAIAWAWAQEETSIYPLFFWKEYSFNYAADVHVDMQNNTNLICSERFDTLGSRGYFFLSILMVDGEVAHFPKNCMAL